MVLQPVGTVKITGPPPTSSRQPQPQDKQSGAAATDTKSQSRAASTQTLTKVTAPTTTVDPATASATTQARAGATLPKPPPTTHASRSAAASASVTPSSSTAQHSASLSAPLVPPPPISTSAPVQQTILQPVRQSVLQPSGLALATPQPRGPTPPHPAAPTVGLLQKAAALIRAGKDATAADPQLHKFSEISLAGRGLAAHQEMNTAIQATMPKDRASPSYTQVPPTTLDGGDFGPLEQYRAAFNAADFGISDGRDQLGPGTMSAVGLPPLNTTSGTYMGLGYRLFNLKAAVLDFDHGLEVNDPNHPFTSCLSFVCWRSLSPPSVPEIWVEQGFAGPGSRKKWTSRAESPSFCWDAC